MESLRWVAFGRVPACAGTTRVYAGGHLAERHAAEEFIPTAYSPTPHFLAGVGFPLVPVDLIPLLIDFSTVSPGMRSIVTSVAARVSPAILPVTCTNPPRLMSTTLANWLLCRISALDTSTVIEPFLGTETMNVRPAGGPFTRPVILTCPACPPPCFCLIEPVSGVDGG